MNYQKYEMTSYNLHVIQTDKFKNTRINIKLNDTLNRDTASIRALITLMLMSGSEKYPTQQDVSMKMESLYGGSLGVSIGSTGLLSVLDIKVGFVDEQYLDESIFEEALDVLVDRVYSPIFKADDLEIQKDELIQRLKSVYDNKGLYSMKRTLEIVGKDTPFSVDVNGYLEEIPDIKVEQLQNEYQRILKESNIDVFVIGNVDEKQVEIIKNKFSFDNDYIQNEAVYENQAEIKFDEVFEEQEINQGKLNLAYYNNTTVYDKDYYPAIVFNAIFGGMSTSKLFMNIREKHSLAYTVFSKYEALLGLNIIHTGINSDKYDKTIEIIDEQLNEMIEGNISDLEMELGKKTITSGILKTMDSPSGVIRFYYSKMITKQSTDIDGFISKVNNVSREDVVAYSKKIKKHKLYFLHGGM